MRAIGVSLGFLLITALGCSTPTAPTMTTSGGRTLQALGGFSITAQATRDACSPYTGVAKGACQQLVALDCDSAAGGQGKACQDAVGRFVAATGQYPPFLQRVYVSHDPQECAQIRWGCFDAPFLVSFSDATGCGCQQP